MGAKAGFQLNWPLPLACDFRITFATWPDSPGIPRLPASTISILSTACADVR